MFYGLKPAGKKYLAKELLRTVAQDIGWEDVEIN